MSRRTAALAAALLVPALAACASNPATEPEPTEPVAEAPAAEGRAAEAGTAAPAPEPAPAPVPARETSSKLPPTTVVIGTASDQSTPPAPEPEAPPRTLADAARAERRRRAEVDRPPVAVINDKNLADWASRGALTEAKAAPAAEGAVGEEAAADGTAGEPGATPETDTADAEPVHDEAYWRRRALEARERWRDATDRVEELEQRVADLRWDFYAEDDPYYRDSEIKPLWDRALDDLRRARQEVRDAQRDLDTLLDEGYREGALPGWLREGIELEPEPAADEPGRPRRPGEHQTIEPPVVEEPAP